MEINFNVIRKLAIITFQDSPNNPDLIACELVNNRVSAIRAAKRWSNERSSKVLLFKCELVVGTTYYFDYSRNIRSFFACGEFSQFV